MYYGNQECKLVADIGNEEAVIELCIGEVVEECGDENSYSYPYETKIIVNKRYLTESPLDKHAKVQECKDIINEAAKEVALIKSESNKQIREEKSRLEEEIKLLKERSSKFKGISEYVNFLEGKYNYIVYLEDYRTGIRKLDEIMCSCTSSDLAAVSFRSGNKKKWNTDFEGWLYINEYSDDSGQSKYKVRGFSSLEDAKAFFGQAIADGLINLRDNTLVNCDKHGVTNSKIEAFRAKRVEERGISKQKEIKDLETKLAKLSKGN